MYNAFLCLWIKAIKQFKDLRFKAVVGLDTGTYCHWKVLCQEWPKMIWLFFQHCRVCMHWHIYTSWYIYGTSMGNSVLNLSLPMLNMKLTSFIQLHRVCTWKWNCWIFLVFSYKTHITYFIVYITHMAAFILLLAMFFT